MRAYELTGNGFEALIPINREDTSPGPGEVKIKTGVASINYRDYALIEGIYQPDLTKPFIPLSDGAGAVVEIGDDVTHFAIGDRVLGHYTTGWLDGPFVSTNHATKLGGPLDGWLAETVILPEAALLPVPDHMTLAEAATLPVSGLTAWTALDEPNDLTGKWVLIEGTGSVSLSALQIAHAVGAKTVVMSGRQDRHETLYELGATKIIDYHTTDDMVGAVLNATGNHGIDMAVEVLGGEQLLQTTAMMADEGSIAIVGFLKGFDVHGNLIGPLLARQLSLRAVSVGSRTQFERYLEFLSRNRIHPVVGTHFPFQEAATAIHDRGKTPSFGKPVIIFDNE
ncbi:hypothetical protein L861_09940 [Litchfieldella anticariensis FP35 = DSM 16096]|uniref:Enoyl reductase (ER) domain-containing protein n=1 Tax=Litchfieldella anticariensis (strain DSM 16096 / CECT 5854 / CIP 108499 / LMG 22089 / FP35) TaxID=1121939 RepID=S2KL39_LITA3|nr:NAD(P)-dependent alcohol dehydrogenase [Halomonas anticariensis]EPC02655.1 hypothetical protein L861_09940 [Halomonas anticariensis FP35 = DSM 16096]